jgi:hypothetical protein
MAVRMAASLLIAATVGAATLLLHAKPSRADFPQVGIEFQDGFGNAVQSVDTGATAVFYVGDADLRTVLDATATWAEVPDQVVANSWWSLATGAPHPEVHAIGPGSSDLTGAPSLTPLASTPIASVDGVTYSLGDLNNATGAFTLLNDVDASNSLVIVFTFDIVDTYPAEAHRTRLTSTSDAEGEWVAIGEVVSETDSGAHPVSGVFRGDTELSADVSALTSGDGIVRARPGDTIVVTYFEADGSTPIATDQVQVTAPAAALPAAGWLAVTMLAIAFALLASPWVPRKSSPAETE